MTTTTCTEEATVATSSVASLPSSSVDQQQHEETPCFGGCVVRSFQSFFQPNPAMTHAYMESQRPGYTERPSSTGSLPQKPSPDNPRNRSPWYRNR